MNFMRTPGRPPLQLSHTFDRLLAAAEVPATYYGLLASEIDVAGDFSQARFVIDRRARWHDGTPVTSQDVAFTFRTLGAYGLPFYRSLLKDMDIRTPNDRTIILRPATSGDWQWIDQLGRFPIQSKAWWSQRDPGDITLDIPMGSGPFRVERAAFNKTFRLVRADDYWAIDHPLNQGRWNFDAIQVEYFFDTVAMVEALKRGVIDVLRDFEATDWQRRFGGPALEKGRIVRTEFRRDDAGTLRYLVMNLRRPPLDDIRVRKALNLAIDPVFYHDLWGREYDLPGSFYGQTRLAARGSPDATEVELLSPFAAELPAGIFDPIEPPGYSMRARLREASALLDDAGFPIIDGFRVNPETDQPLTFEFVTAHPATADQIEPFRFMLGKLGIKLDVIVRDYVSGRRLILDHAFDFTMVGWNPSDPPGASEQLYWHSSQARQGSYGLAGLQSAVADALIETMRSSVNVSQIVPAARAFDRLLQAGFYTIPLWHDMEHRFVHDAGLGFPQEGSVPLFPEERWFWRESPE
ncbi:MAG: ABC transporter substrate-binding protein [Pseudomonadota bacterium]